MEGQEARIVTDRRQDERDRRKSPPENDDGLVMRPVSSKAAIEHARQLLEQGAPGIEEREDGRLWALGVDRRQGDRRGQP